MKDWEQGRKITYDLPTAIDLQSPAKCAFSNFAYKWSNIPNKLSICGGKKLTSFYLITSLKTHTITMTNQFYHLGNLMYYHWFG